VSVELIKRLRDDAADLSRIANEMRRDDVGFPERLAHTADNLVQASGAIEAVEMLCKRWFGNAEGDIPLFAAAIEVRAALRTGVQPRSRCPSCGYPKGSRKTCRNKFHKKAPNVTELFAAILSNADNPF
jgi:hypothetical protein